MGVSRRGMTASSTGSSRVTLVFPRPVPAYWLGGPDRRASSGVRSVSTLALLGRGGGWAALQRCGAGLSGNAVGLRGFASSGPWPGGWAGIDNESDQVQEGRSVDALARAGDEGRGTLR